MGDNRIGAVLMSVDRARKVIGNVVAPITAHSTTACTALSSPGTSQRSTAGCSQKQGREHGVVNAQEPIAMHTITRTSCVASAVVGAPRILHDAV